MNGVAHQKQHQQQDAITSLVYQTDINTQSIVCAAAVQSCTELYRIMLEVRAYVQVDRWSTFFIAMGYGLQHWKRTSPSHHSLSPVSYHHVIITLSLIITPYQLLIIAIYHYKIDGRASWLASKLPSILARWRAKDACICDPSVSGSSHSFPVQ